MPAWRWAESVCCELPRKPPEQKSIGSRETMKHASLPCRLAQTQTPMTSTSLRCLRGSHDRCSPITVHFWNVISTNSKNGTNRKKKKREGDKAVARHAKRRQHFFFCKINTAKSTQGAYNRETKSLETNPTYLRSCSRLAATLRLDQVWPGAKA